MGLIGIRSNVRHGSVTATCGATRPEMKQRLPEGNRWSEVEPPSGFEPETYALRVSVTKRRSASPSIICAGQSGFLHAAMRPDAVRTATETATARRALCRSLIVTLGGGRPRAGWRSLGQLGAGPTHVPADEFAQHLRARTTALGVHGARRRLERLPLVVWRTEAAGGVVFGIYLGCHAREGTALWPQTASASASVRGHKTSRQTPCFVATKPLDL